MDEERLWDDAFTRAAESDRRASDFDVAQDVARGRRRVRRTQSLTAAAAGLAVTAVVGATLLLSPNGATSEGVAQPVGSGDATPTFQEPRMTLEPSPSPTPTGLGSDAAGNDPMEPTRSWRNGIYDITASVLDPEKKYLNYATQSLQSGGDGTGGIHLGIKLGWSVPGRPGEGMVQVQLSTETGPDAAGCWEFPVGRCQTVLAKSGLRYEIGRGADGQFVVIHEQSDGERVLVYVDPLFRGNALVPVQEMAVTEGDVLRLVQDDRLDLPR